MSRHEFIDQLRALGHQAIEAGDDRVSFPYTIPIGKFSGREIRLGFTVPSDFPMTPPGGPHLLPRLLPLNSQSKTHPSGGIHKSPFGPEWEYWSRPFPGWKETDRTARTYMAHIRSLFETQ